jgi:hypothetical protein
MGLSVNTEPHLMDKMKASALVAALDVLRLWKYVIREAALAGLCRLDLPIPGNLVLKDIITSNDEHLFRN